MDKETTVTQKIKKEQKKQETSPKTATTSPALAPKNPEVKKDAKPKTEVKLTLPKVKVNGMSPTSAASNAPLNQHPPPPSPSPGTNAGKGKVETLVNTVITPVKVIEKS